MLKQSNMAGRFQTVCCFLATLFPKVFCIGISTWGLLVLILIIGPDLAQNSGVVPTGALEGLGILFYGLAMYSYLKVVQVGPGSPLDYPELRIRDLERLNPRNIKKVTVGGREDNVENVEEPILGGPYDDASTPFLAPTDELVSPESPPTDLITIHTKQEGGFRFCTKCSVWKPDRTHHCSSSGKCILRMDHYCPWFTVCIGHFNHKFFVQFLAYVSVFSWVLFGSSLTVLWRFFVGEIYKTGDFLSINVVCLFILSAAFGGATTIFTFFSFYLVLKNLTTIELHEKTWNEPRKGFQYEFNKKEKVGHIFDIGYKKNWQSVMGESWAAWLLPISVTSNSIYATKNGVNFEVNEEVYQKWRDQAKLQDQLNRQLHEYNARRRNGSA